MRKKNSYEQFFQQARSVRKKMPSTARRTKSFSFGYVITLVSLFSILAGLGWWTLDPELPDKVLQKIEVSWMGTARAEEKTAPPKEVQGEKTAAPTVQSDASGEEKKEAIVSEDLSHFAKLRERKADLDLREKELNELEEELHKQKDELQVRIRQLEVLRAQISSVLKERVEVDQEKVSRLVETYSSMKPKQAADILSGLDENLSVEILGKMKKKNAAEIMNLLEPAKARSISEKYAGYKKP